MQRDHWDSRYASSERLFSAEPDGSLVELAHDLPPGRALDVVAVDQSRVALERLDAEATRDGLPVTSVLADMNEYLSGGGRFDLVVLANLHPDPDERAALLAAAAAALTAGGHLFLVGHHVDSLGVAGPDDPRRLYTEELLSRAFPSLQLLRLERRAGSHGDTGRPSVDVVAWAVRPAGADDSE
jgi:SAM-dependent methyltransferase